MNEHGRISLQTTKKEKKSANSVELANAPVLLKVEFQVPLLRTGSVSASHPQQEVIFFFVRLFCSV